MHKFFVVQFTVCGLFLVSNCFEDMDIQQISSLVESSEVVNFNLRVKKTSRLTYGVSGYIEILDDSMDKYTVTNKRNDKKSTQNWKRFVFSQFEIKIFHSANGNNQFKLYPMGFRTMPIKRFMNRQYREYFMDDLKPPVSELPYSLNQWSDLSSQVRKVYMFLTVCSHYF